MIAFLLALAASATIAVPPRTPIYCAANSGKAQPINDTDFARLAAAFEREFRFRGMLTITNQRGRLTFREQGGVEKIAYDVKPLVTGTGPQALVLQRMRVQLTGVNDTKIGDDMCSWTFGLVNDKQGGE